MSFAKTDQPEHLVSAVRSRVIRYRSLRALMARQPDRTAQSHQLTKKGCAPKWHAPSVRTSRCRWRSSTLIISRTSTTPYGHPAGDRVIKNLSRLLRQRLRGADIIGRYGGEEFALALPDTPLDLAVNVINHLRESFAAIEQHAGSTTFHNTFAGAAEFFSQQ